MGGAKKWSKEIPNIDPILRDGKPTDVIIPYVLLAIFFINIVRFLSRVMGPTGVGKSTVSIGHGGLVVPLINLDLVCKCTLWVRFGNSRPRADIVHVYASACYCSCPIG